MAKVEVSEGRGAKGAPSAPVVPGGDEFIAEWNAVDIKDRRRIRRLVKLGRPLEDPSEAALAVAYGKFQRSRIWAKLFWLWFVPGLVLALGAASQVHSLLIGVVLMLSAQALNTRRNLRRVERVNASALRDTSQSSS
jgi:hypothetical protein